MKKLDLLRRGRNLLNGKISVYMAWGGLGLILFGMIYTVLSVGLRYTIGQPIPGDIEIPAVLLPVAVALFYTLANVQKRHIRATILVRRFSARSQTLLESIYSFIGAFLFAIVTWQAVVHGLGSLRRGWVTQVVHAPIAPFEFLFAVAMTIFCLHLLIEGIFLAKQFAEQR